MEPYYAGWLSLLPPVVAIVLALVTKEVISSLLVGVLTGTTLYAFHMDVGPVPVAAVQTAFSVMVSKMDADIAIFCSLLGALVCVITRAGGAAAYGRWATRRIGSKKSAMLATSGLGAAIFIDDYFNCLTVGTVMRPVTDTYRISRAKLAYIIDSTAAPVCIIAPISSWAAAVGSNLRDAGVFESEFGAFVASIPYNFYALLCLGMVLAMCFFNLDFGPMRKSEEKARAGELGAMEEADTAARSIAGSSKGHVADMLVPIGSLVVFAVLALLYAGGYWGEDPAYHTVGAAFGNTSASKALVWASFGALVVALVMFVPRRLMSLRQFMDGCVDGMKTMLPAVIILMLAWTISGVCRDLLQTPEFVKTLVSGEDAVSLLLPALVFVIAGFLSFSTGTAWGTFGILIPIVVPVAQAVDPQILVVTLSATLAGSVFGDHCSPISDTTILSSAGAACNHMEHVSTQLPYALMIGACCVAGYVVAGLTRGSLLPSLGTAVLCLAVLIFILHRQAGTERQ